MHPERPGRCCACAGWAPTSAPSSRRASCWKQRALRAGRGGRPGRPAGRRGQSVPDAPLRPRRPPGQGGPERRPHAGPLRRGRGAAPVAGRALEGRPAPARPGANWWSCGSPCSTGAARPRPPAGRAGTRPGPSTCARVGSGRRPAGRPRCRPALAGCAASPAGHPAGRGARTRRLLPGGRRPGRGPLQDMAGPAPRLGWARPERGPVHGGRRFRANPRLRACYQRLHAAGKPPKVALTACCASCWRSATPSVSPECGIPPWPNP